MSLLRYHHENVEEVFAALLSVADKLPSAHTDLEKARICAQFELELIQNAGALIMVDRGPHLVADAETQLRAMLEGELA